MPPPASLHAHNTLPDDSPQVWHATGAGVPIPVDTIPPPSFAEEAFDTRQWIPGLRARFDPQIQKRPAIPPHRNGNLDHATASIGSVPCCTHRHPWRAFPPSSWPSLPDSEKRHAHGEANVRRKGPVERLVRPRPYPCCETESPAEPSDDSPSFLHLRFEP